MTHPNEPPQSDESVRERAEAAAAEAELQRRVGLLRWYCARGMRLVPIFELLADGSCACDDGCADKDRGKHPRLGNWLRTASSDWARVEAWHNQWPGCNWAWVLDDHFVIDDDPRNGGFEPAAFFEGWEENVGFPLPHTWTAQTGGGGLHAVFRQPGVGQVRSGKLWLNGRGLSGLELKGVGGYVLVEPSNHVSGGRYRWLSFDEPAEPSVELLGMRRRRGTSSGSDRGGGFEGEQPSSGVQDDGERFDWAEALTKGAVPPGDQQTTLYRAACSLRAREKEDDEAVELLRQVVRGFVDGDESDPWTPEHADAMWERVKDELPSGSGLARAQIVRDFRPDLNGGQTNGDGRHLTLVRDVEPSDHDDHADEHDYDANGAGEPPVGWGGERGERGEGGEPPTDVDAFGRNTDRDNAEELVRRFGDRLMFTPGRGWWVWDGRRWRRDRLRKTWEYCAVVAESLRLRAPAGEDGQLLRARAQRLDMVTGVNATLTYAEVLVGVEDEQLDADPLLLNCPNGTLDLRTFELRRHDAVDRITRCTEVPYDPEASSALLDEYHATFMPDDADRRGMYKLLGSCVAGGNDRRLLVMLIGGTTSGKSQLASGLERALGDYVGVGNASIFRGNMDDKPRPDIITLLSARIALLEEAGQSWELHGDRIKHMTGGGTVSVRPMRSDDFITMTPQFTPVIIANEMPRVKGADQATRRRLHVVPFTRTPDVEDPLKKVAFLDSVECMTALLAQVVAGYRLQLVEGLEDLPTNFGLATAQAFDELDDVPEFIRDAFDCELLLRAGPEVAHRSLARLRDVHSMYVKWVHEHGDATQRRDMLNQRSFNARLRSMGWVSLVAEGTRWSGVQLAQAVPYRPFG